MADKSVLNEVAKNDPARVRLGDLVVLKSGGHLMTVASDDCLHSPHSSVSVIWSHNGTLHDDDLPRGCLRHATVAEVERATFRDDLPF